MRRFYVIWLAVLGAAVLAGVGLGMSSREPVYRGLRLSVWLRNLRDPSPRVQHEAQEALGQMGPDAVFLVRGMLHAQDSPLATNLLNLVSRQSIIKVSFAPARERRIRAALACVVLGAEATPAVPDLVEFSKEDAYCFNLAESALGHMGEGAVEPLMRSLTNRDYAVRRLAAGAFRAIGPPASVAAPWLVGCLKDEYMDMRATAARALGRIGVVSPDVVRALAGGIGR